MVAAVQDDRSVHTEDVSVGSMDSTVASVSDLADDESSPAAEGAISTRRAGRYERGSWPYC